MGCAQSRNSDFVPSIVLNFERNDSDPMEKSAPVNYVRPYNESDRVSEKTRIIQNILHL